MSEPLEAQVQRLAVEREGAYKQILDLYTSLEELAYAVPTRKFLWRAILPSTLLEARDKALEMLRTFDNHPAFH